MTDSNILRMTSIYSSDTNALELIPKSNVYHYFIARGTNFPYF